MDRIQQKLQAEREPPEEPMPGLRLEDTYKTVVRFDSVGAYLDLRRPNESLQYTESGIVVGTKQYDSGALTVSVGANHLEQGNTKSGPVLKDITTLFRGLIRIACSNGLPTYFVHEGRDIVLPPKVNEETVLKLTGRSQENLWVAWLARGTGVQQKSWEPETGGAIASLRQRGFSDDDIMAYLGGRQFRQAAADENPEAHMKKHVIDRYAEFFPNKKYTYEEMLKAYADRARDHVRPLQYMAGLATLLTTLDNPYTHLSKNTIIDVARAHNLDRHHHHLDLL
jgi:hypothetical protein